MNTSDRSENVLDRQEFQVVNFVVLIGLFFATPYFIWQLCHWWGWYSLIFFGAVVAFSFLSGHIVTFYLHRVCTHESCKIKRRLEVLFALGTAITLQGKTKVWVLYHKLHHAYVDTEMDPHTPRKFKNPILAFIWSHIAWNFWRFNKEAERELVKRYVPKRLQENTIVLWMDRLQLTFWFSFLALLLGAGWWLGGWKLGVSFVIAYALALWLMYNVTWSVNSIAHMWGDQPFTDKDDSREVGFRLRDLPGTALRFLGLGEHGHNKHHWNERCARHASEPYHWDSTYWLMCLLERVGWAWDVYHDDMIPSSMRRSGRTSS